MPVHFKICGITSVGDADLAIGAGASSIGLNLIPTSSRVIDVEVARDIVAHVGKRALSVLVVADLSVARMQELMRLTGAGCLQLHGQESGDVVQGVLPHAYKALRVGSRADVAMA